MNERAGAPGPMLRRGPRPLLLHLALAGLRSRASPDGLRHLKPGSPNWNAALAGMIRRAGQPDMHPGALLQGMAAPDSALIAGIAAYRRHPWRRDMPDPPAIWTEGGSRLLDYGTAAHAPVLLVVPSLVNRAYVLDLAPNHSLLRWLAAQGVRPLLLDWGWPGPVERAFSLTDYVAGRLERALVAAHALGGPLVLAGYCMGGNLAVAAATRRGDLLRGLALLATPWDFHGADPDRGATLAALLPDLEPVMALGGALPIDALQMLFALLDPLGVGEKYRAFAALDPDSPRAHLFVALEDWLNDGVPLAAPVARECLRDWYGKNLPMRGEWRVAGAVVDPTVIRVPSFVAAPGQDRIVPPESARPLAALIPGAVLTEPAAGHIGMAAGRSAERVLWRPMLDWVSGLQS